MYTSLLSMHSLLRWFVLYGVLASFILAVQGIVFKRPYSKVDEVLRRAVSYIGQLQVGIGLILYFISPITRNIFSTSAELFGDQEIRHFALIHPLLMILGICCCVVGVQRARKKSIDKNKFKTMALWYFMAFVVLSIAIPWPDSTIIPNRPLLRGF